MGPLLSYYNRKPVVVAPVKVAKKRRFVRIPKAGPSLTQTIKNVIASESETKYVLDNPLNCVGFNSAIATRAELYSCCPPVGVGLTSCQRVGQKITPKSLFIKGAIGINPDDLTVDIVAVMYVFTWKKFKNFVEIATRASVGDLLDNGQASTTTFNGDLLSSLYAPNKEAITLLAKKTFHLQKGYGVANGGSAAGGVGGSTTLRHFNVKIKTPKNLLYDDSVSPSYSTNFAPVVAFGYYHADGTPADVVNQAMIVTLTSHLYYDDA